MAFDLQVYLQVGAGEADSWNAQFSSMMTNMLQDTYRASGMQAQHDSQVQALLQQAAPKAPPPKVCCLEACPPLLNIFCSSPGLLSPPPLCSPTMFCLPYPCNNDTVMQGALLSYWWVTCHNSLASTDSDPASFAVDVLCQLSCP